MTTEVSRAGFLVRQFPSLASRDYTLLFVNSVFAAGANWALLLARGWLVFEITGSSAAVGVVTFAGMAPFVFASPIAGALADRMDRRLLSIWAAYISLFGTVGLAIVTIAGVVEVWQVVIFSLLGGIARAVQQPSANSMIPNLVPPEHLLNAIALQGISVHGTRVIGPLLGGVILAELGAGPVFLLSAILMAAGTVALWMIRYRPTPRAAGSSLTAGIFGDIAEGMAYIGRDPRLALVITLVVLHCALTMAFDSMMPGLSADVGGGPRTYSAILMGLGAGAVVGTVMVSRIRNSAAQGRAMLITGAGSGVAMVVMGLSSGPVGAVLGAALAGATQASYMSLSQAFVQEITPDRIRGRVIATFIMLAAGHMAFVNLGFGAWADFIGVRPLLIVPGLIWTAIFGLAILGLPELRLLLRTGRFRERRVAFAEAAGGGGGG
jgi:MFS family permease